MLKIINGKIKRDNYILEKINIKFDKGTLNLIVGKNAAGKSSLLYAMTGAILLEKGNISKDFERLAYVGDGAPFNEAIHSLDVEGILREIDPHFNMKLFNEYLRKYDIEKHKKLRDLSKGQIKLLMLSIALSRNVDLLLLDEITLNIDALRKDEMKDLISNFLLDGEKAIVLSTNQLEVFEDTADTVTYIKENRVAYHGPILDLVSKYQIWQGSKEEFKNLNNVVSHIEHKFSVEALIRNNKRDVNPSLKDVLILLERADQEKIY